MSQDLYQNRSFPRSFAASLTVVYSAVGGVVPNSNFSQRKASLSTIAIHVNVVVEFACIRRYAASRSIFPIRISFFSVCFVFLISYVEY